MPSHHRPQVPNLRRIPAAAPVYRSAAPAGHSTAQLAELELRAVIDLREPEEAAGAPVGLPAGCRAVAVPLYCGPVPLARPLAEVYRMLLEARSSRLVAALSAIAETLPDPVLVHCKAGKDRTGLVIALLLEACAVPRALVLEDYQRSATGLGPDYRSQMTRALTRELGAQHPLLPAALELHLDSPAQALAVALDGLVADYGSVAGYLLAKGLEPGQLEKLRCLASPANPGPGAR